MTGDRIRAWLDRNSQAENAQIWSIILLPIWMPVLFGLKILWLIGDTMLALSIRFRKRVL